MRDHSARLAEFGRRVSAAGATCRHVEREALAATLAAHEDIVVTPRCVQQLHDLGVQLHRNGTSVKEATVDMRGQDIAVGVGWAEAAIAETGSLLMDETDLRDRLVDLQSVHLIVAVEAAQLVDTLEDASAWFESRAAQATYATLMSGPSRTADIERSLTIGVQGSQQLDIVVVT